MLKNCLPASHDLMRAIVRPSRTTIVIPTSDRQSPMSHAICRRATLSTGWRRVAPEWRGHIDLSLAILIRRAALVSLRMVVGRPLL